MLQLTHSIPIAPGFLDGRTSIVVLAAIVQLLYLVNDLLTSTSKHLVNDLLTSTSKHVNDSVHSLYILFTHYII